MNDDIMSDNPMNDDIDIMHNGTMNTVTVRGTVVIDVEACKGCDLCIDACPPRVLVMTDHQVNNRGYRYPRLLAGCTGCRACAQICPDFVFQVYKYATPMELEQTELDPMELEQNV